MLRINPSDAFSVLLTFSPSPKRRVVCQRAFIKLNQRENNMKLPSPTLGSDVPTGYQRRCLILRWACGATWEPERGARRGGGARHAAERNISWLPVKVQQNGSADEAAVKHARTTTCPGRVIKEQPYHYSMIGEKNTAWQRYGGAGLLWLSQVEITWSRTPLMGESGPVNSSTSPGLLPCVFLCGSLDVKLHIKPVVCSYLRTFTTFFPFLSFSYTLSLNITCATLLSAALTWDR